MNNLNIEKKSNTFKYFNSSKSSLIVENEDKLNNILNHLTSKNIDFSNLSLAIKYKKKLKNTKYNNIENDQMAEIFNYGSYKISEFDNYLKIKDILYNFKTNNYTCKFDIRNFLPKVKLGDLFIPIYGYDFNNEKNFDENFSKEKKLDNIESNNQITVINISYYKDFNIFKGISRISTSYKILNRSIEYEEEFKNIKFHNIFFEQDSIYNREELKTSLENLELLGIKNLKNYFIEESDVKNSKEYFAYDIKENKDFFLIIDEENIIRHIGEFQEFDNSLEDKIIEIIERKRAKEKNKENIVNNNNNFNVNNNNGKELNNNINNKENINKENIMLGKII